MPRASGDEGTEIFLDADAVAEPEHLVDVAMPFQLGHLKTAFRLLNKDQDGLVSVADLRFHYQSQGCELAPAEALQLVDAVACTRKGYYAVEEGDIREVEVAHGFDLPEFVAFCVWRLASEEPAAGESAVGSGLCLDPETRRALAETLFVRMKGFDERVADTRTQTSAPLGFHQFWEHVVARTKLHKGPFGVRRAAARLQFELLAQGTRGAALAAGIESTISNGCGAAFADADHAAPDAEGASYASVAAFFSASCCRVGAEDDDAAFEQLISEDDEDAPAPPSTEKDDEVMPPWTRGDSDLLVCALDTFDADERALCALKLWMQGGKVEVALDAESIAAAIDAGDPHAVLDAVAALLRARAALASIGRRRAFIRVATEASPRGVAGQRHHLCILLGELPPYHRAVLERLAKHLARVVRRQRLNGSSWRGLAAAVAPLVFGHGVATDADEALWATVACVRLLRVVNATAGGPKIPRPVTTPATSPEPAATPPRPVGEKAPDRVAMPAPTRSELVKEVPTPTAVTPSRGERRCVVVRAFSADAANELSVAEGDVVLVPAADLANNSGP